MKTLRILTTAVFFAVAFVFSPLSASTASADLGGFVIKDFHSDITVESDGGLLVEETILVNFTQDRHGIYRTIPVNYTDPRGFSYGLRFKLLDVVDENGGSHGTKVTREGRNVKIRIGDADRYVFGLVTYVIRYHVDGAVTHLETHDELYWDAVGDEWATTIAQASAVVHLPGDLAEDEIEAAAYSGPFGSTEGDVSIQIPEPSTLIYANPDKLEPYEAMTIVAGWPHGYVEFPSEASIWLRRILQNWIVLLPLAAFVWMRRRYHRFGRDPEGDGSIMVRYEPPEGVGPGEIGTLIDEKVDMRDITATVVDLAVKGYMRIEVEETEGFFKNSEETFFSRLGKENDPPLEDLLPHERAVLNGIFEHGKRVGTSDLKNSFYTEIPGIKSTLMDHLVDEDYFAGHPNSAMGKAGGLAVLMILGVLGIGAATALLMGAIFPTAMIIPVLAAIATAVLTLPYVPAMPQKTKKGVHMREWALGFQEFVDRVEADRLERSEAMNAFEALLPYAMALGVASKWAKKFEGIYDEGHHPGWYVGPHYGHGFSTRSFEKDLSTSMSSVSKSMVEAPRSSSSSGFGGGGFSGGGFGGGGGGSW